MIIHICGNSKEQFFCKEEGAGGSDIWTAPWGWGHSRQSTNSEHTGSEVWHDGISKQSSRQECRTEGHRPEEGWLVCLVKKFELDSTGWAGSAVEAELVDVGKGLLKIKTRQRELPGCGDSLSRKNDGEVWWGGASDIETIASLSFPPDFRGFEKIRYLSKWHFSSNCLHWRWRKTNR